MYERTWRSEWRTSFRAGTVLGLLRRNLRPTVSIRSSRSTSPRGDVLLEGRPLRWTLVGVRWSGDGVTWRLFLSQVRMYDVITKTVKVNPNRKLRSLIFVMLRMKDSDHIATCIATCVATCLTSGAVNRLMGPSPSHGIADLFLWFSTSCGAAPNL